MKPEDRARLEQYREQNRHLDYGYAKDEGPVAHLLRIIDGQAVEIARLQALVDAAAEFRFGPRDGYYTHLVIQVSPGQYRVSLITGLAFRGDEDDCWVSGCMSQFEAAALARDLAAKEKELPNQGGT